jgi:hypothetical protein
MTGVIVIEDDDRIRRSLVLALDYEGYTVPGGHRPPKQDCSPTARSRPRSADDRGLRRLLKSG